MNEKLVPGTFIKTRGARDRVGLRKIVSIRGDCLLVDHYKWVISRDQHIKKFKPERVPYSSEVMASKVDLIYTFDEDGYHLKSEKV